MRKLIAGGVMLAAAPIAGGAHAAGGGGGGGAGVHFVELADIAVPIVESDRVAGALRMKIVLDAADGEAATRLGAAAPRLRAAAVGAALEFARLDASAFRAVDAAALDHALSAALNAVEPGIAHVLIVEVAASRAGA